MASTAPHTAASSHTASNAPASSTYRTQSLPVAVPLPDFWHQQRRPSPSNAAEYAVEQQQSHHRALQHSQHDSSMTRDALLNAASSHPAWTASSSARSHQQLHHQQPSHKSPSSSAPLAYSQPPHPHQQQQQQRSNAYYAQPPPSSCYYREPASADNSLPIHHHYPVASTSSSKGLVSNSTPSAISVSHGSVIPLTQAKARAASPAPAKKVPSNRNRSATIEVQHQKSEGSYKGGPTSGPDTPSTYQEGDDGEEEIDEDPELTARFSSVSQIEAQPTLDPDTGEAIYPCPFCDKSYGGKHARSIWRRHLSNKHGIPLNLQPRRTRWDNDVNRPKDEAERHKRTLESKRRWAAKNRAEKRAKRKGTTVEEELGLIEAAEAAGNHSGSIGQDEENDHPGDESFNASEMSVSLSHASVQHQHQPYSVQERQNWQDQSHNNVQQQQQQQQSVSLSQVQYATSGSIQHPQNGFSSVPLDNAPPPHQIRYLQPQTNYGESTYTEGDAGHQASYTLVYPTFSLPPSAPSEARQYQRSPSQPEFPLHIPEQHQGNMHYAPSVSPMDGSLQFQSQQPVYHVQQGQSQNMVQPAQHSRILQTVPLLQQPFLAPPSVHQAPSLQRSVSAPIPQAMPLSREHTPLHASQLRTNDEVQPATHAQIAYARQPAVPTRFVNGLQQSSAQQNGIVPNGRPTSANGMSIYIPPPPQGMQAWTQQSNQQHQQHYQQQHQQQQNTPLAHGAPLYTQNGTQQPQQPPTPYYYLSVPDSTPIAEHQLPVTNVLQPVPMHVSMQPRHQQHSPSIQSASVPAGSIPETAGIAQVPALEAIRSVVEPAAVVAKTKRRKESKKKSTIVATESSNSTTTGKASKKKAATTVGEQTKTNTRAGESIPQAVQLTKTYQEAAMQLLALASSSPPPSPVKELNDPLECGDDDDDVEREDRSRSMDGEGSSYAEDSGYVHFGEDSLVNYKSSNNGTRGQYKAGETQQGQEDEEEEEEDEDGEEMRRSLRFADIPPSSPAQLRMSLSPESSPLPMVAPSKLSATYLRAQASAGRSTPIGMKRKYTINNIHRDGGDTIENDENAVEDDIDGDEDGDEEGERISLDSSPEREDLEMKAPLSKRSRLISMSSVSPGGEDRQRLGLRKGTSSITTSRSPSPNRYINSGMSSFATSVIMSTPHQHQHMGTMGNQGQARMDKKDSSSSIPSGLFSFAQGMGISKSGASEKEHVEPKRHAHRTSIFKIDNCSRPSAGLGMIGTTSYSSSNNNNHSNSNNIPSLSSSSPSRPYLLSSPEHAAVSKSLGLVPDNYNHNKLNNICLPSDGEGFEMHFLRGFGGNNDMNGRDGENGKESNTSSRVGKNGLSEYAKDVFGGYL